MQNWWQLKKNEKISIWIILTNTLFKTGTYKKKETFLTCDVYRKGIEAIAYQLTNSIIFFVMLDSMSAINRWKKEKSFIRGFEENKNVPGRKWLYQTTKSIQFDTTNIEETIYENMPP